MSWTWIVAVVVVCVGCSRGSPAAVRRMDAAEATTISGSTGGDWDEFDLDGKSDWLKEIAVSPSSIPSSDYDDYIDEDDDDISKIDVVSNDDVVHQDSEEDEDEDDDENEDDHPSEFMFVPEHNERLLLQDDDGEQGETIKVRHTGKNTFSEPAEMETSKRAEDQFDFTIDEDEEESSNDKDTNLLDSGDKDNFDNDDNSVKSVADDVDDEEDDDDEDDNDDNSIDSSDDDAMFQSPQEDTQVMYGDHVFLY